MDVTFTFNPVFQHTRVRRDTEIENRNKKEKKWRNEGRKNVKWVVKNVKRIISRWFSFLLQNNGFCKEMYGTNGRNSVQNKKRRGPMKINVLRHLNSNYHERKGKRSSHTGLIQAVWYEDGERNSGRLMKERKGITHTSFMYESHKKRT